MYTPVVTELGKWRQEGWDSDSSLGHMRVPSLGQGMLIWLIPNEESSQMKQEPKFRLPFL